MNQGEIILYTTEDGEANIRLRAEGGTVWLNQAALAELFQTTKQNISLHVKNILGDGELNEGATVKESLTVQTEGDRHVQRKITLYNLEMILAVGYRVSSPRGTQFRRWASSVLKDYLVKGFAMDDERLKSPGEHDYFDELLARIRDIRASEKRFYQKVRDIYTTAVDYDPKSAEAQLFFKKVQNKMLWAVTGQTAAELIACRSDPKAEHLGLISWEGSLVRKADVTVAKNYLKNDELDELNRIVVMYLDYAELQATSRKTISMAQWEEKLDAFLSFNEREVLTNPGKMRADVAQRLALERFEEYEAARLKRERIVADEADIAEIERIGKELGKR
jgi:hypothetical protein